MDQSHSDETGLQENDGISTDMSFASVVESGLTGPHLENAQRTEYIEIQSETVNVPFRDDLLPVRMTVGSHYYTAAFRLDESNVCAEAVEAVLFNSLDGECILAEYQQNKCLSSATQQKLTDFLLNRTAKSCIDAKNMRNYLVKLTDSIIRLMPNEDRDVYYIEPQSNGNHGKNFKGKLPDKLRNLRYHLRMHGILPKKKMKHKRTNVSEFATTSQAQSVRAAVDSHMRSLQTLDETLPQLLVHWDATMEYRNILRSTLNSLSDIIREWPVLKTDKGPHFIDYEFRNIYPQSNVTDKWTSFFNALYDVKRSSIRDAIGKEYCNAYEYCNVGRPEMLAAMQIQLLPFLITPTSKFKAGSGIIEPSTLESSDGFVVYCKTKESLTDKILRRNDRYEQWHMPVQPCIALQGPQAYFIEAAYVNLENQLWEVDSPLRALDLAFKLYLTFNLRYPLDCQHVWLTVQKMVYKITRASDKKINNVTSLINVLKVKMQKKRQRTE